jgi:hypothetical protein
MFDQLSSPEGGEIPPEVVQAIEILNAIGEPQIEEWLWALVLAERTGQFEQEYNHLLQEGLDRFTSAISIILSAGPEEVKIIIHQFIQDLAATGASNLTQALVIIRTATLWGGRPGSC